MNTPEWIKYDGSEKQIEEINNAPHGYRSRLNKKGETEYLICKQHPYADLIDIWRLSGCPVYVRITEYELHKHGCREYQVTYTSNGDTVLVTCKPDWNIPGAEYRLTPFED